MISHSAMRLAMRAKALTLVAAVTPPFSRASIATYTDVSGITQTAGVNVLRSAHYVLGVLQPPLIEGARTNSVLWSRDLTNAAWSGGTATTAQNAVGLDGTANSATTVTDADGSSIREKFVTIAIPDDSAIHSITFWVKKDAVTSRFPRFYVDINDMSTVTFWLELNTSTGAFNFTLASGVATGTVIDGGLWWIVKFTGTNNSSGNDILLVSVSPAAQAVWGVDSIAATGSVVIGQVQVELNASVGTSPIFTTSVPVTRAADVDPMLAATATGYTRATGSFVTEGFAVGMEITPAGFVSNPVAVLTGVTALALTTAARTVEAAAGGRSLTVGLPASRAWENVTLTPTTGKPFVEEQYIPGPNAQVTLGPNGELELTPMYALHIHVPSNTGGGAALKYADALLTLFAPRTALPLTSGDVLRVRSDTGPFPGQLLPSIPGFAVVPVTVPFRLRTQNSI